MARRDGLLHRGPAGAPDHLRGAARARRAARPRATGELGVGSGDRVATLAWNDHRHVELYYAHLRHRRDLPHHQPAPVPGADRLHRQPCRGPLLFVDPTLCRWSSGWRRSDALEGIRGHGGQEPAGHHAPNAALLRRPDRDRPATSSGQAWTRRRLRPVLHIRHHRKPKGVLYHHRSTVLHAWRSRCQTPCGCRARRGAAHRADVPRQRLGPALCAPAGGAKLVMPGPHLDGASLHELIEATGHLRSRRADRLARPPRALARRPGRAPCRSGRAAARRLRRPGARKPMSTSTGSSGCTAGA